MPGRGRRDRRPTQGRRGECCGAVGSGAPVARYELVRLGGAVNGFRLENGVVSSLDRGDRAQDRLTAGVAFRPFARTVEQATVQRNGALRGRLLDPGIPQDSERGFSLGAAIGF